MVKFALNTLLLGLAVAGSSLAGPVAVRIPESNALDTRVDTITIATKAINKQWDKGHVFFNL